MKEIKLSRNQVAFVDDEDFEYLNSFKWCYSKRYAQRTVYDADHKKSCIKMHRLILKTPEGMQVDHINHNGLDNRKCNIRNVTAIENSQNRAMMPKNKAGKIGVHYDSTIKKWRTLITVNKKRINIGTFEDVKDAIFARQIADMKYGFNLNHGIPLKKYL